MQDKLSIQVHRRGLRENSIPYKIVGGFSFFDKKEIKDIAAYLRVILNTDDDVSLLRIINFPRRGIGPATINSLKEYGIKEACYPIHLVN